jgi:hypothetical protein
MLVDVSSPSFFHHARIRPTAATVAWNAAQPINHGRSFRAAGSGERLVTMGPRVPGFEAAAQGCHDQEP